MTGLPNTAEPLGHAGAQPETAGTTSSPQGSIDSLSPKSPPSYSGQCGGGIDLADADDRGAGGQSRLQQLLRRAGVTVIGLLMAGLLLPAATKQWSDRAAETAMKKELVTKVNEAFTDLAVSAQCVAENCAPEFTAMAGMEPDDPTYYAAAVAQLTMSFEALRQWSKSSDVVQGTLVTYFPDDDVVLNWKRFSDALPVYLRLASAECGEDRAQDTAYLKRYISDVPEATWVNLSKDLNSECRNTPLSYTSAFDEIGDALRRERDRLTHQIISANAVSYSTGIHDFLDDLWPF